MQIIDSFNPKLKYIIYDLKNDRSRIGLIIVLIASIIASYLLYRGVMPIPTFLTSMFAIYLLWVKIMIDLKNTGEQATMVGIAYEHILIPGHNIDEFLGLLISDKWRRPKANVVDEFFKNIHTICKGDSYELKRRVAEALPALFRIDFERTKDLASLLRNDWDLKMKSDIRRRTIESLSYAVKKDKKFVISQLSANDKDEIFTIIAIVELMHEIKLKDKKFENHFKNLLDDLPRFNHGKDELEAIDELWSILNAVHEKPPREIIELFKRLKDNSNIFIQICVARNIKHLFDKSNPSEFLRSEYTKEVLNLMSDFLQKDRYKYVRKPIAKESSVDFLINLLNNKAYCFDSKEILWKLFKDEDESIRIAALDKIDKIFEIDEKFGEEIASYIVANEKKDEIVERAKKVLKRIKEARIMSNREP